MDPAVTKALILDMDGVLSPVHGRTAWGDDTVVGQVFGDVLISPTLAGQLRHLTEPPHVTGAWLSSWLPSMRTIFDDYLGADWPQVGNQDQFLHRQSSDHPSDWWKWECLSSWLEGFPHVCTVVWCDDDLGASRWDDPEEHGRWTDKVAAESVARGVAMHLIAPETQVGVTRRHLTEMAALVR